MGFFCCIHFNRGSTPHSLVSEGWDHDMAVFS